MNTDDHIEENVRINQRKNSLNTILLPDNKLSDIEESTLNLDPHDKFVLSNKYSLSCITVEPLVMFYILVSFLQTIVIQQYIYYRIGVDYNITANSTAAYVCSSANYSAAEKAKVDRLQDLNTRYLITSESMNAVTTTIFAPFFCVFSDRFGRRSMLIIPGVGVFLKSLADLVTIKFNLPLYFLIITNCLYGCFGGFNFAVSVSYSYVADITTRVKRTRRLALLEAMLGIGSLIVSLISGIWIKSQGYLIPYGFTFGVSILCMLYPIFVLKEPPKMPETSPPLSHLEQLKTLFTIYLGRPKLHSTIMIVMVVMFVFYYVAEMSTTNLVSTYLMAYPICMGVIDLSIFSILSTVCINLGVIITLFIFTRCMKDLTIILICLLWGLGFCLEMAFVSSKTMAFVAASTNLFSYSAFSFIRGYLSKKMSAQQQGALFGGLVLFETVGTAICKVVVVDFYNATFKEFHGFVYLFIAIFSAIAIVLAIISNYLHWKIEKSEYGWEKLN